MFFIPVDLFTPWVNAREKAIDANWNDLIRGSNVEGNWLRNEAQQYKNWLTGDTYQDQLAMSNARTAMAQNAAETSGLNLNVARLGQPGAEAQAQFSSDWLSQLTAANRPNIPSIAQNAATVTAANSAADIARANATRQYAPAIYGAQGQYAATRAQANLQQLPQQLAAEQALLNAQASQNAYLQNVYGANANPLQQPQVPMQGQFMPQMQTPSGVTTNMFAPTTVAPGALSTTQVPGVQAGIPNAVPVDIQAVQGVLNRLNVGAQVEIPLPGGGRVTGGRDDMGVYIIQNGLMQYLDGNVYQPRGDALDWNLPQ